MAAAVGNNRPMYWRIIRRLIFAHRGRLFVILLALGAGAALTAALLNLQVDAKRRLTSEFRTFGPNVLVLPQNASPVSSETLPESVARSVPIDLTSGRVAVTNSLYLIATVSDPQPGKSISVVVDGISPLVFLKAFVNPDPARAITSTKTPTSMDGKCVLGENVARQLNAPLGAQLTLTYGDRNEKCQIAGFSQVGGPEDDQVEMDLRTAQRLAGLPGRISVMKLVVPGTPREIQSYVAELQRILPMEEVQPVRQFTDAQAKLYGRISGILNFTVAIVLLLTALCVMAAMANVAVERKNDVGLMKAIGGATRRVLRLFLAEAALLGFAGGLVGSAAGIALSVWLGKQVFGVAAQPRLIVYPVAVALTILVAILSAYPLKLLASVRPASVFRGEE